MVKVNYVYVSGLGRTTDYVTAKIISKIYDSESLEELVYNSYIAKSQLESLGLKKVRFKIDLSKGNSIKSHNYDVYFKIEEARRFTGGANAVVDNTNNGKFILNLETPNLFGNGESILLSYQKGYRVADNSFYVQISKPLIPWIFEQPRLNFTVYKNNNDIYTSAFKEKDHGIDIDFILKWNKYITHKLTLQNVWREILPLDYTPLIIRKESGHTLKGSFKSAIVFDNRNHPFFASKGILVRLMQEFAGLYGNVGFHKHEIEFQFNKCLSYFKSIIFQATFKTGILRENKVVGINDKLFLGGPLSLRGFCMNGVGPQKDKFSLGANSLWMSGLHIYTPLPFIGKSWKDTFKTHFFVNAGSIENLKPSDDWYKGFKVLTNKTRISFGLGLAINLQNIAKVELNYCVPFSSQTGDLINDKSIQFGIGINFV